MSSVKGQRDRILPPYTRRADDFQHRLTKILAISAMVLLAMFSGYMLAIFGMFGWFIPAIPVVALIGIALWLAPDVDTELTRPIGAMVTIYMAALVIWPSYLALNLPGLPWISMARLALVPLVLVSLYTLATSHHARADVAARFQSHRLFTYLFLSWLAWEALMLAVGGFSNIGRWVNNLMAYYLVLVAMAWTMTNPANLRRLHIVFLVAVVFTSLMTFWEFHYERIPWVDHIPAFLSIDRNFIEIINSQRIRSEQYRSVSIFLTAPNYGEYIGIMLPFVLLFIFQANKAWKTVLGLVILAMVFVAALDSNARVAMVAFATVPAGMIALWVFRRFQRPEGKQDLLASTFAYGFPAAGLFLVAAILSIGRIRRRVLGGGEHVASNEGREAQWAMAKPVILRNPVGHGSGTISHYVPYTNLNGDFTIDSYPINLLVEYGVPGFLLFFGLFICAAVMGIKIYLRATTPEEEMSGAAALSLISFMTSRLVLSTESGIAFAFPFVGLILAQWYAQKVKAGWAPPQVYRQPRRGVAPQGRAHGHALRAPPQVSGRP